jgi:hypothetical protein
MISASGVAIAVPFVLTTAVTFCSAVANFLPSEEFLNGYPKAQKAYRAIRIFVTAVALNGSKNVTNVAYAKSQPTGAGTETVPLSSAIDAVNAAQASCERCGAPIPSTLTQPKN